MMGAAQDNSAGVVTDHLVELGNPRLEALREKINNEEYLHEAIQRIALILSNELLDIPYGGLNYERQRKGRR
jgi:hypothetical protein